MKSKNKSNLIERYNKLKRIKVSRWEQAAKKEDKIMTTSNINKLMAEEIENLRSYIRQLKTLSTRIINDADGGNSNE